MNLASVFMYLAAATAYALFAAVMVFRATPSPIMWFFVFAATMTATWSGSVVALEWLAWPGWFAKVAVALRDGSWFALILTVLYFSGHARTTWGSLAAATVFVIAVFVAASATDADLGSAFGITLDVRTAGVVSAILGLILIENMMRNLSQDQFWAAKYLGIGLLALIVLQFLIRLPEFLATTPVEALSAIEPAVYLLVLPLFIVSAMRSPTLQLRVHSSRKIVLHTTSLIIIGILLEGTALAAYYVRSFGGDAGTALAIVLGFCGAIAVAVAFASAGIRSRLRSFINENFFSYKYDYRLEWQKFIQALSACEGNDIPLCVLRTLTEVLDSPGGALWVFREHWNQYLPVAQWSLRSELQPITPESAVLEDFEDENCVFLDLMEPGKSASARIWHEQYPNAWLVVPLRYRSGTIGFVLVDRPRAHRRLDWEDKNLIGLVALQLAAYLVQEETAQSLADARQLQEFNKRFAFIVHDTKNTIGQLSLLVRNVEQFGHDENFRKDMIVTLRHSVEKLQQLLTQLKGGAPTPSEIDEGQSTDISAQISALIERKRKLGINVSVQFESGAVQIGMREAMAFLGVMEQVLSNAVEASADGKAVDVRVRTAGGLVQVSVEDKGPGMSQQFINEELFRPLKTTKAGGFGIGAYQARETIRALGGKMDVRSRIGEGTTVVLSVPVSRVEKKVVSA